MQKIFSYLILFQKSSLYIIIHFLLITIYYTNLFNLLNTNFNFQLIKYYYIFFNISKIISS